jgi:hypothetical protein
MNKSDFVSNTTAKIQSALRVRKNQIFIGSLLGIICVAVLAGIAIANQRKPAQPLNPTVVPDLTATLKEIKGEVSIKQAGQTDFSPANVGDILRLHGELQTGSSSDARLDLPSGTIIRVAPSSLFTLDVNHETADGLTTTLNLTLGQIFIVLKSGSLDISVPSGVASVRGSYMSALIYPGSSKVFVTCLEGHCSASNSAGILDLTNGQKGIMVYSGNGANQSPQLTQMNQNDYASWQAISPEAAIIIKENGMGTNGGNQSNCQPTKDHPCK